MRTYKIGVLCAADIAFRRFMPSLQKYRDFEYIGVACSSVNERFRHSKMEEKDRKHIMEKSREKVNCFAETYGGKIFDSYQKLIESDDIDAVYIPLPPSLHYMWAKEALKNGKHVLLEKPATTSYKETQELVKLASKNRVALFENYMFIYHKQLYEIKKIISSEQLGKIRLYRIAFGFPMRKQGDFRYKKSMGGGALLDAGGYTIKLATFLLGKNLHVEYRNLNYQQDFEVDIFGSGALTNDKGVTAQVSFGMDNSYKCELEVWGSRGCLKTGRIFTAPDEYEPSAILQTGEEEVIKLSADDSFFKAIGEFKKCIDDSAARERNYEDMLLQAKLVDEFKIFS